MYQAFDQNGGGKPHPSNINNYPRTIEPSLRSSVQQDESQSLNMSHRNANRPVETQSMHAVSEQHDTTSKLMDKQVGSWSIKGNLVNNGRCPKCTLKIPCKHFERVEDLPPVIQKPLIKALPPLPPPTKQ